MTLKRSIRGSNPYITKTPRRQPNNKTNHQQPTIKKKLPTSLRIITPINPRDVSLVSYGKHYTKTQAKALIKLNISKLIRVLPLKIMEFLRDQIN